MDLFTEENATVRCTRVSTRPKTRQALRKGRTSSWEVHGALVYVLHYFATTQSELMKKRVSRFMSGRACPACDGKRLKREALSVTFAGHDIGELSGLSLNRMADVLWPASEGRFESPVKSGATLSKAAGRKDIARRVAAGGAAPGRQRVRRTPTVEGKTHRAQRLAQTSSSGSPRCRKSAWAICADRSTHTLSPGDCSVRLATRSAPTSSAWVRADETDAGMHGRQRSLVRSLDQLKASAIRLFVVENDLEMSGAQTGGGVGPARGKLGGRPLQRAPEALRTITNTDGALSFQAGKPTATRHANTRG